MSRAPPEIDTTRLGRVAHRPDWSHGRLALLGDIHGNNHAFLAAYEAIKRAGLTRVAIHGDLLSYGCTPNECLATLQRFLDDFDCVLLAGNHEAFYFVDAQDTEVLFGPHSSMIADSIRWTRTQIEGLDLAQSFPWHDTATIGPMIVRHANPYRQGSWHYVDLEDDELEAATEIEARGARWLVVGHTHRPRLTRVEANQARRMPLEIPVAIRQEQTWIFNTGSIGQPRGNGSTWLEIDLRRDDAGPSTARVHRLDYNIHDHLETVKSSGLPDETIARLCRYFVG